MTLDRLGILGSSICAIHCALPLLVSFLSPSFSSYFENEWIHYLLLVTVIPLALFSFVRSRSLHMKNSPLVLGFLGILFLVLAISVEEPFGFSLKQSELLATVLGSSILILSHFLNLKFIRDFKNNN